MALPTDGMAARFLTLGTTDRAVRSPVRCSQKLDIYAGANNESFIAIGLFGFESFDQQLHFLTAW